jgi:hypothetical protein
LEASSYAVTVFSAWGPARTWLSQTWSGHVGSSQNVVPTDIEDMSIVARSSRTRDRAAAGADQRGGAPLAVVADQGTLDLTMGPG